MKTNKIQKILSFSLMLILAISMSIATLQLAYAQTLEIDTYVWVMASPNPVGVDQWMVVTFQLDKTSDTASGPEGGDHFNGFMVNITKPDGSIDQKGPYEAWAISGAFFFYTPNQVGTYKMQAFFPGQWINTSQLDRYYRPSQSPIIEVEVTQDPVPSYPDDVMDWNDYWTRPIYAENKGWWQFADNWLMQCYDYTFRHFTITTAFSPYSKAPDTGHVMWSKQLIFGGIPGGQFGDATYYTGLSYEQHYNPLILEGRIIYTEHLPTRSADITGTRCVDLYTGEEIWFLEGIGIDFAQVLKYDSPNEHGTLAHLWRSYGSASARTMEVFDAFTGTLIMTIENVTWGLSGSNYMGDATFGPNGEILSYSLDSQNDRLILWNSTLAIQGDPDPYSYSPRVGSVIDGQRGIQWNVSIPDVPSRTSLRYMDYDENVILAVFESKTGSASGYVDYPAYAVDYAFPAQLTKNSAGEYPTSIAPRWQATREGMEGRIFYSSNIDDGKYTRHDTSLMRLYAYDAQTGNQLWETGPTSNSGWGYFMYQHHIAYGKLIQTSYDGYVRAFNMDDGSNAWNYYFGNAGYETVYGSYPTYSGFNIADGKVYVTVDEHSPDSVLWRGAKLHVIDIETGEGVWNISGMLRHGAISDGYYTVLNNYDGKIFTFGKGPSQTMVTASKNPVALGEATMIQGTVMDQSVGQLDTPCISDEDMSAWMEYLHMQKKMPEDATGVPVTITAVDPSGAETTLGTVTSDSSGKFALMWTPNMQGTYKITANFAGSDSYGSSIDTTYVGVGQAPQASPTTQPTLPPGVTPTPTPATSIPTASPSEPEQPPGSPQTDVYVIAAIAAVVIIVAAVAAILLRRRK